MSLQEKCRPVGNNIIAAGVPSSAVLRLLLLMDCA
jgi:hypothetical protein